MVVPGGGAVSYERGTPVAEARVVARRTAETRHMGRDTARYRTKGSNGSNSHPKAGWSWPMSYPVGAIGAFGSIHTSTTLTVWVSRLEGHLRTQGYEDTDGDSLRPPK